MFRLGPHSPSCCPRELPGLNAVVAVKMDLFSSPRVPQSTWIHRDVSRDCTLLRQLRNEAEQSLWSAMETIARHHFRAAGTALATQGLRGRTFPHILLVLLLLTVNLLRQPQPRAKMKVLSLTAQFRTKTLLWPNLHSSPTGGLHCAAPQQEQNSKIPVFLKIGSKFPVGKLF